MSAPVQPGASRPNTQRPVGPPAGYNPNFPRGPDASLSQNFQNLQLNRPQNAPVPPFGGPSRPPPFGQNPSPFSGLSPVSRPGPPPPGVVPRGVVTPGGPPQSTMPSIMGPGRPSGPMPGQPPFASRGPPPGSHPPGVSPPPFQGSQPIPQHLSARPSGFGSSPATTGPLPSSSTQPRPISNGPPFSSGAFPGRPPVEGAQQSFVGGPPPSGMQPPMMHPYQGSQRASGPPAPPMDSLSGPSQPASPFSVVPQRGQPPSGSTFGQQPWQTQPRQVPTLLSACLNLLVVFKPLTYRWLDTTLCIPF